MSSLNFANQFLQYNKVLIVWHCSSAFCAILAHHLDTFARQCLQECDSTSKFNIVDLYSNVTLNMFFIIKVHYLHFPYFTIVISKYTEKTI